MLPALFFLIGALLVGPLVCPVVAQSRDRLEVQAGGGYVWGGGTEDPGPSLSTYNVGAVFWLTDGWGIAGRHVRGPGEDLDDSPVTAARATFSGSENLRYTTVTARRRWSIAGVTELNLGFGLMLGGSFEDIVLLRDPGSAPLRLNPKTSFGGFALELLVGRKLSRHFGVKVGFTEDFNLETNNTQLVGLAVFSF